jgi:hypothetical protein
MIGMNLKLKRFEPEKIGDNRVCVFIGKRGTGKTTLVTDILWHKRQIPCGVVISGTEEGNGYYSKLVPDSFVYSEWDKAIVERIIERQKKLMPRKTELDTRVFVLLDDCAFDKRMFREKCLRNVLFNGRHFNIFLALTLQYCMDMGTDMRSQIDYLFILREPILANREKLYKNFCGIFPTFDIFDQVLSAVTQNFGCLVIDNTSHSNCIEDCVFWYKAEMHPPFKVGSERFWKFHRQTYNKDQQSRLENAGSASLSTAARKKGSVLVSVEKVIK